MADLPITSLPMLVPSDLQLTDLTVIVNNSTTKQVELSTILAASSAFYVPYINLTIAPPLTTLNTSLPFWNATYSVVSTLSSVWTTHFDGPNLIIGSASLVSGFTGYRNIVIGEDSLLNTTLGSGNVAIGYRSLYSNVSGSGNTAIGYNAGYANIIGNNNTYIGNQATGNCPDESNAITLGNGAIKILRCQANSITSLSDKRDKSNINQLNSVLSFINQLNPVSFTWNTRDGKKIAEKDIGFIAQELQEAQDKSNFVVPGLVNDSNPEILEASYAKLLPVLVKAIQELTNEIEVLKSKI